MIPKYTISKCNEYGKEIFLIKKQIHFLHTTRPFLCDKIMLELLKKYGISKLIDSYKPESLPFDSSYPDLYDGDKIKFLKVEDIIGGYYDIPCLLKEMGKGMSITETKAPSDIALKTIQSMKWRINLFKGIGRYLNFKSYESFYNSIMPIHDQITEFLESSGVNLPTREILIKDLIRLFLQTREKLKPFLPPINKLTVNDILYVVDFVHGGINIKTSGTKVLKPETVHVPETMQFYRIMASEYGAVSCTTPIEVETYKDKIANFLKLQTKKTEKNNTKVIERIVATLLKKTKGYMKYRKMYGIAATQKQKERYDKTDAHVNIFSNSDIVFKNHYMYLYDNDLYHGITVVHPQIKVNLVDYIDIKIDHRGIVTFNLSDIMALIKHIKYVLFIDLSCSSTSRNVTNNEIAQYKSLARRIEGPSITERIERNIDLSPFNESPGMYTINENQRSRSRSRSKTRHLSLNRTKSNKSKRSKLFSSLSLTRYKRNRNPNPLPRSRSKPEPSPEPEPTPYVETKTPGGFDRAMNI